MSDRGTGSSRIDRWAERLAWAVRDEVRARFEREADESRLLADLTQKVREILSAELVEDSNPRFPREVPQGLVDEMTLATYLVMATQGSPAHIGPDLLLTLGSSLRRELGRLDSEETGTTSLGGKPMKKTIIAVSALLAVLVALPQDAEATPEFAKQWASSCASCHVGAPPALDEEGTAFKLAGYYQPMEASNPRPKLFLSLVTDLVSFSRTELETDEMSAPESATLFSLMRIDRAGKFKVFAIGDLTEENNEVNLEFAHGHLQINPLTERENFGIRLGNVEPVTRLWNSDMRRLFDTPLWGSVDTRTGEVAATGGGHAHGGSTGGGPAVLPASDWGGDVSAVIGRNLMVGGGYAGDTAFAGIFYKRGGRGFDNSTYAPDLNYDEMTKAQQSAFSNQQVKLARKWERSVIFGLSAYDGSGTRDVFDGTLLSALEVPHDDSGMGDSHDEGDDHGDDEGDHGDDDGDHGDDDGDHGDDDGDHGDDDGDHGDDDGDHGDDEGDHGDDEGDHGDEGEGHGEEAGHSDAFLPTRLTGTSRLVGEIKTRWNRYGLYLIGVYGENDYEMGDASVWEQTGQFFRTHDQSSDFSAWAVEGSARFRVSPKLTGRVGIRYEELSPEDETVRKFRRAVVSLAIPLRMMRPAVWPYVEVSEDFVRDEWAARGGLRLGY